MTNTRTVELKVIVGQSALNIQLMLHVLQSPFEK